MFGDGKVSDLFKRVEGLSAEFDAIRNRLDRLEAKLEADSRADPSAGLAEALNRQQGEIEQLRLDNVALVRQIEDQARQAQLTATALFQRIERIRDQP